MRKPFVVANWKMNKNVDEALSFLNFIIQDLPDPSQTEVGIAPQAFAIYPMTQLTKRTSLQIIGQNAAEKCNGAYTGEISVRDLASIGVNYVILGHTERRNYFKESDQVINKKVITALRAGVKPIICTNNQNKHTGFHQLKKILMGVPLAQLTNVILAFEPIEAVGIGKHANMETAQYGCQLLREVLCSTVGARIANQIRILYGGSVNANNISSIMAAPDIDGVLIGRASLDPYNFAQMINYQKAALSRVI